LKNEETMQTAQVIRATDHGTIIQLLCIDGLELISVYFEHEPYSLLCKAIQKAGLKLEGLQIRYDRHRVHVLALGKTWMTHTAQKERMLSR
jgi:hypothetical protein